MDQLLDEVEARRAPLEAAGFQIHFIWECQWNLQLKDPTVKRRVDALQIMAPLEPRAGLAGGRTNAIMLYYKVKPGERVLYYDIKVRI